MNKPERIFNGNVNIDTSKTNFMNLDKIITEEQYIQALAEKQRLERYLDHLTRITRDYQYQWERERIKIKHSKANTDILP